MAYNYYCDCCGHAFNTPKSKGWFMVNGRDEDDSDGRCPKCDSPDYENLEDNDEFDDLADIPDYLRTPSTLDSGLYTANI